jgi:hypothetical protein
MIKTLAQILDGLPDQQIRLIKPVNSRDIAEGSFGALLTTDPTPNDDVANTAGNGFFGLGSWWFNTATDSIWRCKTGSPAGSAVWVQVGGTPTPTPTITLPPASVFIDGSTNSYLSGSPVAWLPGYPDSWSVAVWFYLPSTLFGGTLVARASNTLFNWRTYIITALNVVMQYADGTSSNQTLTSTDALVPSTWNLVVFGYDSATNEMLISINGGTPDRATVAITPTDTADVLYVNVLNFFGTLLQYADGPFDELAIFNTVPTDEELVDLWNNGEGLYFPHLPCRLFNGCDAYWPFSEPSGPYVDVSSGHTLSATGNVSINQGICGFRPDRATVIAGTNVTLSGPQWQPTVAVEGTLTDITTITVADNTTDPPAPSAGNIVLYQIGDKLYSLNPGVVKAVVGAGASFHPWDNLLAGSGFLDSTLPTAVLWNGWQAPAMFQVAGGLSIINAVKDNIWALPILSLRGAVIDQIGFTQIGLASKNVRVALYRSTATPGDIYPDVLILDSGDITVTVTGDYKVPFFAQLEPSIVYWLCVMVDTNTVSMTAPNNGSQCVPVLGFPDDNLGQPPGIGFSVPFTYAPYPVSFPASTFASVMLASNGPPCPCVLWHAAS